MQHLEIETIYTVKKKKTEFCDSMKFQTIAAQTISQEHQNFEHNETNSFPSQFYFN